MKKDCEKCGHPTECVSGRCNDCYKCDDCGAKDDLIIAEDGVYCHDCLDKIINDDIKKFDGDTKYTSNIICPHCGYEDQDSWEMTKDSGEVNCSRCDKEFFVERDVTVTYSTSKC